ncbi:hypothetical protein F0237_07805 [Vibrio tubiashii]|uniref:Uncharacterized protein n=1 Tax=Vibrio tubiashii TaxID=29498 RepID=A0AAE5GPH1_9VIBR|nr:hypothetical protein [Vibrio tubiashii]NOI80564.1 hypothetical protein [Vibrio tubiashii]
MRKASITPLGKALLGDKEIKRALLLKQIEDICLEVGLLNQSDVVNKSEQWQWVADIVDDHIMGSGLLRRLMFKNARADDGCELFNSIVRDIVERLMTQQKPFPHRR